MKIINIVCSVFLVSSAFALTLEEGFKAPPSSAKPHTWYHMMNGNVTKEGITCDFEALAKAGVGGVQMFDAGCAVPPGPLAFNSPEWFDMFKHAAAEARRLGLEICIPNCSGWSSSGGPWNMPSNGMKKVVFTETTVKGGARFNGKLVRTKEDNGFYEDIALLAFPLPAADRAEFPGVKAQCSDKSATLAADAPFTVSGISFRLAYPWCWGGNIKLRLEASDDGKSFRTVEEFTEMLGQSGSCDYSLRFHSLAKPLTAKSIRLSHGSATTRVAEFKPERRLVLGGLNLKTFAIRGPIRRDTVTATPDQVVAKDSVLDLTKKMAKDGSLDWTAPASAPEWMLLRVGHVCNGRRNHPASDHGVGLEVDKLSATALDYHFDQYVTRLCRHLGNLAGDVESGFNNILVDSYEVGSQNWTQRLEETFAQRKGYSMVPYLPAFAGHIVGSVDETERFLEDFRRVVADLFAENYSGHLAELCHRHGLKLSLEPYGNCPADNLQYGESVDIPMGEFWSNAGAGDHADGCGNSRYVSHISHVWGRRYVGTESFTASPGASAGRWVTTPFSIKAQGDNAYVNGVNRIIYHRFTHQPWPGNKYLPGMTMGRWGMHLDRTQTWWPYSGEWFKYQARCQWMLQEGTFVADALFFTGEQAPNQGGNTDGGAKNDFSLPYGYAWDVCPTKAMKLPKVGDGRVVVPGGVAYRVLALPYGDTMSAEMLGVVEKLLDAGAKVCAPKRPTRSPGLVGYPNADAKVAALAERIWAKGVMECTAAEALARLRVEPDFVCNDARYGKRPGYIHRRAADAEWYFVALNNVKRARFTASFRVRGKVPEIWDAEKGECGDAPVWRMRGGRTEVDFDFPPSGSAFVVFRRDAAGDFPQVTSAEVSVYPRPDPVVKDETRHTLVIKKAEYGHFPSVKRPRCAEVSAFLKPGVAIRVSNEALGGDPAQNVKKVLEVRYGLNGTSKIDVVKEHEHYTLPVNAMLKSAWYGEVNGEWKPEPKRVVDIAAKLNERARDGAIDVELGNGFCGDPAYLVVKKAVITYVYDGVESTVTVAENHRFTVPVGAVKPERAADYAWRDGKIFATQPLRAGLASADGARRTLQANPPPARLVEGEWKVAFPVDWYTGGTAVKSFVWPSLRDWISDSDPDIRYFSGTATYEKRIDLGEAKCRGDARIILDLGDVKKFAEVTVNGRTFPVLWRPPYSVDITPAIAADARHADVKIKVTNLWPNRLIGDDALPEDVTWSGYIKDGVKEIGVKELPDWVKKGEKSPTGRHTFTTWRHWAKDEPLLSSGLLGPVLLRTAVPATEAKPGVVPEPKPVKGPVEVHAFYYPGTEQMAEWDQVEQSLPAIRPLLGWYDEGNPEVVDWQIKWAVEHGISAFCVDWYWNRGDQRLNHWVAAYYKARHRRHLKWYMMYANHNEPGAHSTEDQIRVTRYWIDNFFKTPEYYTIDGKPVVVYWSFDSLDADFRAEMERQGKTPKSGDGAKYALELTDRMAKDAGLPGVCFIDMYHGRAYFQDRVDRARNAGYSAQMIYNFDSIARSLAPEALHPGDTDKVFAYDAVVAGAPRWWEMTSRDPAFPLWPVIPTGWNDIPRSFEMSRAIYGRTPEKFAKVCRDCRAFCEKKGFRRVIIAPLNEWQEGSYIEPNDEFGFGMYDALRDAFCDRPAEGWPANVQPCDVGLGPYDYPKMPHLARTAWTFDDGTVQGWYRHPYGTAYVRVKEGKLWFFRSFGKNRPAIRTRVAPFAAGKFSKFRVRMCLRPGKTKAKASQVTGNEKATLWWGSEASPCFSERGVEPGPGGVVLPRTTSAHASVPVKVDGKWHEYEISLKGGKLWRGDVNEVWFDPAELPFADVLIDWMRFE